MTPAKLIEIAKRGGVIRWTKSNIVECVTVNQGGWVRTRSFPRIPTEQYRSLKLVADYACEEVTESISTENVTESISTENVQL